MIWQPWTRALPWVALVLLIVVALLNLDGYPAGGLFVVPIARARSRLDIVVSGLVIAAIPLWFLVLILMFQFAHRGNSSFAP